MFQNFPLLFQNKFSPVANDGIAICLGGYDTNALWIHGCLDLDTLFNSDDNQNSSIFIYVLSEESQLCFSATLHVKNELKKTNKQFFSSNLLNLFTGFTSNERLHIHASYLGNTSNVLNATPTPCTLIDAPDSTGDFLLNAYLHTQLNNFNSAVTSFKEALNDPYIKSDFSGAHLYNAACVCSVATELKSINSESVCEIALAWLKEDYTNRYKWYRTQLIESAVLSEYLNIHKDLDSWFQQYCMHLWNDTDLESIREYDDFHQIYKLC